MVMLISTLCISDSHIDLESQKIYSFSYIATIYLSECLRIAVFIMGKKQLKL